MKSRVVLAVIAALMLIAPSPAAATTAGLPPSTHFYAPDPNPGATQQIAALKAAGKNSAAKRLKAMVNTPAAVWFTDGTPAEVKAYAQEII